MPATNPSAAAALAEFVAKNGPWTAHPIQLAPGVATISEGVNENQLLYLARVVQAVRDLAGPIDQLRVLDLGALEGGFAIELAMQGAQCVVVEGRQVNCDRIRFATEALGLKSVEIVQADVRTLDVARLGTFDVVLCLGLFYHIDRSSILPFARLLHALTKRVCIIDTHVAFFDRHTLTDGGSTYTGDLFVEHAPDATEAQLLANNWASLGRDPSFFFTEPSFCNLMQDLGFSSLVTVQNPYYRTMMDRRTFAAIKGTPTPLRSHPLQESGRHPEQGSRAVVEPLNKLPKGLAI